jgi:hypothetical protein
MSFCYSLTGIWLASVPAEERESVGFVKRRKPPVHFAKRAFRIESVIEQWLTGGVEK